MRITRRHARGRARSPVREADRSCCGPCCGRARARRSPRLDPERAQHLFDRQEPPEMHQLQQAQLKVETLLLPVSHLVKRPQHRLHEARQLFLAEERRCPRCATLLLGRDLQQLRPFRPVGGEPCDLRDDAAPQVAHRLPRQLGGRVPCIKQVICDCHDLGRVVLIDRLHHALEDGVRHRSHELANLSCVEPRLAFVHRRGRDRLVHDAQRIAHRTVARLCQQAQRRFIRFDPLVLRDATQLTEDVGQLDRMKAEVLAARAYRLRNVLGLRGRHHEDDMIGRLLERLQQRVERGIGDLVRLVEQVDLVAIARGPVARGVAQLADLVDAAIGGRVNFDDVDRVARADLEAAFTHLAGLGRWPDRGPNRVAAVQRTREDTCDRRFADAPVP